MKSKILSIEDANRMLPLLEKIVSDLMGAWSDIIQRRTELELIDKGQSKLTVDAANERKQDLKIELNALIDRINGYIREVEELGCFIEEFKRGVVNFPSLYMGRKVFLCWKPTDESVQYWHELDESFNERSAIRKVSDFLVTTPNVPQLPQ